MSEQSDDREEILRLHKLWWQSNIGLDIPAMRTVFPDGGDQYLMFNLNTHPYYNLDEKTRLWEYYSDKLDVMPSDCWVLRLDVSGDMGYVVAEGLWHAKREGDGELKYYPIRATEVYRRDDGHGNPEWRMWHFHGSLRARGDAQRPAFDDTYDERGLGYLPYGGSFKSQSADGSSNE